MVSDLPHSLLADLGWEPSQSPQPGWLPHSPAFAPPLQDPFVAFHINKGLVRKYMNSLLIGELAPEQPSFEPTKNVSRCFLPGCPVLAEGQRVEGRPRWDPGYLQPVVPGDPRFFC